MLKNGLITVIDLCAEKISKNLLR